MDPVASPSAVPVNPAVNLALGFAGGAVGGLLGYFAFGWLAGQGFYAVALPGVLMGLGAGLCSKRRSITLVVVCGAAALALGVFAEWKHFPFIKNASFSYFISHLSDLKPITLLLIALGGVGGAWFAWRARL
jgi:hypothetical protein